MYKKEMITDYEIKEDILEKTIVEWKQKNKNPIDVLPQLTERDKSRLAFWSQYLVICCCHAEAKANRRDFLLEHGFIPKKQKIKYYLCLMTYIVQTKYARAALKVFWMNILPNPVKK